MTIIVHHKDLIIIVPYDNYETKKFNYTYAESYSNLLGKNMEPLNAKKWALMYSNIKHKKLGYSDIDELRLKELGFVF